MGLKIEYEVVESRRTSFSLDSVKVSYSEAHMSLYFLTVLCRVFHRKSFLLHLLSSCIEF